MYQNTIKDFEGIDTNLPLRQFLEVAQAILDKNIAWDSSKDSMMAEYFGTELEFDSARYKYEEISEAPSALNLLSGSPEFVKKLIDEHEADLSVAVGEREYKKANKINRKIESLKKLL